MAGMSIIVCLPSTAAARLDEAVVEAMAPFERDYASSDELGIWDYARICGSADGYGFAVLPAHDGDPRLVHDRPRHDGTLEPGRQGMCAGGPRELLDFTASRAEAEEIAGQAWDLWHTLAAVHPPAESQTTVYRRTGESAEYWSQPLISAFGGALDTLHRTRRTHRFDGLLAGLDPVGDIGGASREEFASWQGHFGLNGRNVLTLGGWWYELGDSPLHGACPSPAQCPHEPDVGQGAIGVDAYLKGLAPGTLLVRVHCHV